MFNPINYFNDGEGLIVSFRKKYKCKCFFESGEAYCYDVELPEKYQRELLENDFVYKGITHHSKKKDRVFDLTGEKVELRLSLFMRHLSDEDVIKLVKVMKEQNLSTKQTIKYGKENLCNRARVSQQQ